MSVQRSAGELTALQNKAAHAPHASMKKQKCPREGCTGRVEATDRVIQSKKKKAIQAALQTHAVAPVVEKGQDAKPRKGPKQAQATKVRNHGAVSNL